MTMEDHVTATVETPGRTDQLKDLAVRSIRIMEDGTREDFEEVLHPEFLNHEAKDEPPAARGGGPAAAYATGLWLRDAFADLRWEIHEVVAEGDLAAVHCTMSGRHVRTFVGYDEDAQVEGGVSGNRQALRHHPDPLAAHRRRPGDRALGQPRRPGHGVPARLGAPTPLYLLRSALAKRRARREAGRAA